MKCSICNNELYNATYKGAKFSFCKNCNSVYIETDELKKAIQIQGVNNIIFEIENKPSTIVSENKYTCSKCGTETEKITFEDIILDRCKHCKIVVFEDGELSKFFAKFSDNVEICDNLNFIKKYFTLVANNQSNENDKDNTKLNNEGSSDMYNNINNYQKTPITEKTAPNINAFFVIILLIFVDIMLIILPLMIFASLNAEGLMGIPVLILTAFTIFMTLGFKTIKPQEAMVFTMFGKYYGTIKTPGFYWVNPFARAIGTLDSIGNSISMKVRTLDSGAQKINDETGNPIQVGIIVTWQVIDTAKALFGVDDYVNFLSSQSDAALRSIIRLYPYDAPNDSDVHSLRGDSEEISEKLKVEIQKNVSFAGIKIIRAKISHLAYAPEIAAAMLQRQQANAILDARKAIVDGSVDMVTTALNKLASSNVQLDEKTKANMVNNLLVALCSNKDNQPVTRLDVI